MSEKEFPPTEARLQQARKKGQVPVSQDIVKLVKFAAITEMVFMAETTWRDVLTSAFELAIEYVSLAHTPFTPRLMLLFLPIGVLVLVPVMLAPVLTWASTLTQTKLNLASKAFDAGWEKLNPVSNLQQLFSSQKLLMLAIGPIKVVSVGWVCYLHIQDKIPKVSLVYLISPTMGWELALRSLHDLERTCLSVLIVLALLDLAMQRWLTYRSLKMDIYEIKRDYKESEGDPHTKGVRKSIAKTIANEDPPAKSANGANAVVVNPQHIAIALAYDYCSDSLPYIIAKGCDEDAQQLRQSAAELNIPVIKYVGLARQLYAVGKVGDHVVTNCLPSVALLFRVLRDIPKTAGEAFYELDEELANQLLDAKHGIPPKPLDTFHGVV